MCVASWLVVAGLLPLALPKLAVAPLGAGDGTTPGMLKMVGENVAAELRRSKSYTVLTYDELQALLSHEQLTQLLGCTDTVCLATLGSAAGADLLATGSLGKVGSSWLISLKAIDVKSAKVAAMADRRLKGGTVDAVLDQLPGMVAELVEGLAKTQLPTGAVPVTATATVSATTPMPAAWAERPLLPPPPVAELLLLTNGKGHYLALLPSGRYDGPLFGGSANQMFLQRLTGGGASGDAEWSAVIWEPRVRERWRGQLSIKDGNATLQCGETVTSYVPVTAAESKQLKATIQWFDVRWQRHAVAIARDDAGSYYFIDQALVPEQNDDYRLFIGTKGKLATVPLLDVVSDRNSRLYLTDTGRLAWQWENGNEHARLIIGASERPLTVMDLYEQAPMIYTTLGVYAGQHLGTLCDPYLEPH